MSPRVPSPDYNSSKPKFYFYVSVMFLGYVLQGLGVFSDEFWDVFETCLADVFEDFVRCLDSFEEGFGGRQTYKKPT